MKKAKKKIQIPTAKNLLLLLASILCIVIYVGYQQYDQQRSDHVAPVIQVEETSLELSVSETESGLKQGITAFDDRDGDVTDSIVVESITLEDDDGTVQVRYAAFDRAGNVAKVSRKVRLTDYTGPRFSLEKPMIYTYGTNFDVLSALGVTDAWDGDIRHRLRATILEEALVTAQGVHRVLFKVTNSLGDTEELEIPVEVLASNTYAATLKLKEYLVYLPVGASFEAQSYLDTYIRNGEEIDLKQGLPAYYSMQLTGQVDTKTPGTYVLEYRVTYTDRSNLQAARDPEYTGYSKLIVIVEG